MRPYVCPNCARPNHFEVRVCPSCAFTLGYDPASDQFLFLADEATVWRDAAGAEHDVSVCENNNMHQICNWLVPADKSAPLCLACRHNRVIPDLTGPAVPERWAKIEAAKRRLFHTLLAMRLPCETVPEAEAKGTVGLAFSFLYDPVGEETGTVQITTGHEDGLVTLNVLEADDVQREKMRTGLGEPYRTLLGHFRHEVGHYYWSRLVEFDPVEIERFRKVFGDERISYEDAMKAHYGQSAADWSGTFVSSYATMHPWEDWAETYAHLLHIIDALATIGGFGMRMTKWRDGEPEVDFDPYRADTRQLVREWLPFAFAENAINRSMGQPDLYPFLLAEPIVAKLDYINGLLQRARGLEGVRVPERLAA